MRRVLFSVVALGAGVALVAAAALAGPEQKKGGTLRIALPRDLSVDPALPAGPPEWQLAFVTCANLYSHPDKPAPEGATLIPEVARASRRSRRTEGPDDSVEANLSLPHGPAGQGGQLRRGLQPRRQPEAVEARGRGQPTTCTRSSARTRLSTARRRPSWASVRSARTRCRSGPRGLLGDLAARLTMPFFCPIATNTPATLIDDPLGSGPTTSPRAFATARSCSSATASIEAPAPRTSTGSCGRSPPRGPVALRSRETSSITASFCLPRPTRRSPPSTASTRGRFFFSPSLATFFFAFNHDRPAFKGPGQIPLKQAINWAIDRPALVRAAGYLGGKRTDQILPPAMGRGAAFTRSEA